MTTESNRIEYKTTALITSTVRKEQKLCNDDFFAGYSNPTSREIMRIYKDLELVEHLGSGLSRILKTYDKNSFVIKQNYMKNIFYINSTFFAKELNTSVKNIELWLKQLKDEDKIELKGSPKTGGYIIK